MGSSAADEAASDYAISLEELTFNSKPIINSLTMIAEECLEFAPAIVGVIERTLSERPPDKKLPLMYLLDSISKNVGGAYVDQFAIHLPDTLGETFDASGPKVQRSLQALVRTWEGVFPVPVVSEAASRVAATGAPEAEAAGRPAALLRGGRPVAAGGGGGGGGGATARKRGREDAAVDADALAATAEARVEVDQLSRRVQTHMRAGLPPDAQLKGFAARLCALYGQILATNPPDGARPPPHVACQSLHTTALTALPRTSPRRPLPCLPHLGASYAQAQCLQSSCRRRRGYRSICNTRSINRRHPGLPRSRRSRSSRRRRRRRRCRSSSSSSSSWSRRRPHRAAPRRPQAQPQSLQALPRRRWP